MVQLALCLLMIALLFLEFAVFGNGFCKLFRLKFRAYETGILGFFVYFGFFQIEALPLILLQRPFHELAWLWTGTACLVNLCVLLTAGKALASFLKSIFAGLWRIKGILLVAVVLLVFFVCWFQGTQPYVGWDTVDYVGTVNTTVYTDTMYVYQGNSGAMAKELDLRYALSAFYMHSALLCKLMSAGGMIVQKYIIGTVCVLMHAGILFAIGRHLFPEKEKKALFFTGLAFVMHLGFYTNYSVSDFLMIRAYEAKGFCANVVIPAMFYAILRFWQDWEKREHRALLFVVCFSSIPVSMSSLAIIPAMLVIAVTAHGLVIKSPKVIFRSIWYAVPNGMYLILYFLYTRGFQIMIHK